MNKKMLFAGALAVTGFIGLTAFGGKTRADQTAEIKAGTDAKLAAYASELQAACDARVEAEAMVRYEKVVADREAAAVPTPGGKKVTTKKGAKGPKADPLPQATKPTTDPQKTRGGAAQEGNVEKQKERSGAAPTAPAGEAPAAQKKRGGAVKEGGGK